MKVQLTQKEWQRKIEASLALDFHYSERFRETEEGTPSAVLLFFAWNGTEPALLMTRRSEDLEHHRGQMAFPGGVWQREDGDLVQTALREAQEEVGISIQDVTVLGSLPDLYTPTGFKIRPFIGVLSKPSSSVELTLNAAEIAEAFWIPISVLESPAIYTFEHIEARGLRFPIHVFTVRGHRIWGATGAMIKNLLDRLRSLG